MKDRRGNFYIHALLVLGVTSLVFQVLYLRELVMVFYGNEMFIGVSLSLWLIGTGVGSLFLGRLVIKAKKWSEYLLLFSPIIFTISLIAIRLGRVILGSSGVLPSPLSVFSWIALAILPVAMLFGVLFVVFTKLRSEKSFYTVSRAYIIESIGIFAGALLYSFYLVSLPTVTVILAMAILLRLNIFKLTNKRWSWALTIILIVFGFIGITQGALLDRYAAELVWPKEKLLAIKETKYGIMAVSKNDTQTNLYYNGQLIGQSDNQYYEERLAHIPLLLIDDLESILLIGQGQSGLLKEIMRHDPGKVVYPVLDLEAHDFASLWGFEIPNNIELVRQDGRRYLSHTKEKFSTIIINIGNPNTLAENRFYTREFFSTAKERLINCGILAFELPISQNFLADQDSELLKSMYKTLGEEFPHIYVSQDNGVMFIASQCALDLTLNKIEERYDARGLDNYRVSAEYIVWRHSPEQTKNIYEVLKNSGGKLNTDDKPEYFYKTIKLQNSKFPPWSQYGVIVSALILIIIILIWRSKAPKLLIISALPEFCLIAFEVSLVYWFQTVHGYLYTQLAFVIASIIIGIALGSWLLMRLADRTKPYRLLKAVYLALALVFSLAWLVFLRGQMIFELVISFYAISMITGLAIGMKFPIVNKIYLKQKTASLGAVYGADLLGGALGALLVGTFLLPLFGIVNTIGLLALLLVILMIVVMFYRD